jgi:CARDB/IPT/TIG domain
LRGHSLLEGEAARSRPEVKPPPAASQVILPLEVCQYCHTSYLIERCHARFPSMNTKSVVSAVRRALLGCFCLLIASQSVRGAITALSVTGPSVIEPGQSVVFNYRLQGQNSVTSTVAVVFYLAEATATQAPVTGVKSERIGGIQAPLAFQALIGGFPYYQANVSALPATLTAPQELTDSSWSTTVRFKGSIPPGNYRVIMTVAGTSPPTYAYYPVTVEPMTITGFTPSSAIIGQSIQISGAHLDRATQVFINGAEVYSFDRFYSSTSKTITATVPSGATVTGKVEVRNAVQSPVLSSANFSLRLPDITLPANPSWNNARYVLSHSDGVLASTPIKCLLKNSGTLQASNSSLVVLYLDNVLWDATTVAAPIAVGAQQILTFGVPPLSAGNHTLKVVADESTILNRELDETNNTLIVNFTVTLHPVDAWRTQNFPAGDLNDPAKEATVYGDNADPDGDGWSNLWEYHLGSSPTSPGDQQAGPFLSTNLNGQPVISYRRTSGAPAMTVRPEISSTLQSGAWSTPSGYTTSVNPEGATDLVTFQLNSPQGSRFFTRLNATRIY